MPWECDTRRCGREAVGERVTKGIGREVRDIMTDDILEQEQPETSARQVGLWRIGAKVGECCRACDE